MASNVTKQKKEKLIKVNNKKNIIGEKLSIWSLIYLWMTSTVVIQGSFNYAYFQGTGYSQVLYPSLKKIFKSNKEKLKSLLLDNIEFFNTSPALMGIISAMHISLLQSKASDKDIKAVKFALMGPLAGMGDAMFNFGVGPLIAGIAAALSSDGSWTGFWFITILTPVLYMAVALPLTIFTYWSGERIILDLSSKLGNLVKISSMVGITIIGALAVTYTHLEFKLNIVSVATSNGSLSWRETNIQSVFDKLVPFLLPALLVGFMYIAMSSYKWTMYKALIFILILGMSGYVYGILG